MYAFLLLSKRKKKIFTSTTILHAHTVGDRTTHIICLLKQTYCISLAAKMLTLISFKFWHFAKLEKTLQ